MRRSTAVKLTLLPMLASAAVAAAEPPLPPADPDPSADDAPAVPDEAQVSPPGATQPLPAPADPSEQLGLAPPGMTPTLQELDCDDDPNWRLRDDCFDDDDDVYVSGGVIRGGFGSYFWSGGRGGHGGGGHGHGG